ncbi:MULTISPECIES: arginine--tRNA ligase [Shouchella]|jgi:arginyl-tRNA synthetase|uniref:arginine--tRNA ligase n=1 Tax=Shouchella TaxID=2893057 RepID=UPI000BA51967|nr:MULTISPECIES: arginine--tRNA ligase [Shouchella]MBU8595788.1 arginine--tRNA ligase [Shouchella clausii]MCM3380846.1 arginine--tRNA ligase [Shouchella rhizosphaerae]MCY1103624.1 arginine--tRNA ligase [Shouchella clausii]MDO7284899.1 arginine--tRNA ligase [Shouchella clausii]MDO7305233.1 arginine--tRNA ligase [Shouchella clausii]
MNHMERKKEQLRVEVRRAVLQAELATESEVPSVLLEAPKDKAHGDFATNIAMQLARIAKKAPRAIAEELVANFDRKQAGIEKIEIAGPGFINFFLDNGYLRELIPQVLTEKDDYGSSDVGQGEKVLIEFVSANPTGDLHLGHARGAAVGDTIANIMDKAGYKVSREYYINDAGNQIENLAASLNARYLQVLGEDQPMPEDGYHGQDIIDIAKQLVDEAGDQYRQLDEKERLAFMREYGLKKELEKIKQDLNAYRVEFDKWFSETSLYESGQVERGLQVLKDKNETYEKDGATWLRSTAYGDDKDRVLVKQDGTYTYLTPDISYHLDKFDRGHDRLIDVLGADHHGYIPRMRAAIQALGYDPARFNVQIIQMVSLFQGGEKVKMSKRTGKAVTLRELMEEVGVDATRYFFAMRSPDTHLDFDMDLAVSKSNENPVYYIQYAHARVCSILRQGEELGIPYSANTDLSPIASEKEYELLKAIGEFPGAVAEAATKQIPQRIANYAYDLAQALHSFYNVTRVIDTENKDLSAARLALMKATQMTIKNALALLGVEAPEKM